MSKLAGDATRRQGRGVNRVSKAAGAEEQRNRDRATARHSLQIGTRALRPQEETDEIGNDRARDDDEGYLSRRAVRVSDETIVTSEGANEQMSRRADEQMRR